MTQTSVTEARLSEAWAFLCGESCTFVQVPSPVAAPPAAGEAAAVLPIRVDAPGDGTVDGACRVVLSDEQARQVASFLFGVGVTDVSPADLQDAVLEACNVLGSCLAHSLISEQPVHIGCPEPAGRPLDGMATQTQFRAQTLSEPRLELLAPQPIAANEDRQP